MGFVHYNLLFSFYKKITPTSFEMSERYKIESKCLLLFVFYNLLFSFYKYNNELNLVATEKRWNILQDMYHSICWDINVFSHFGYLRKTHHKIPEQHATKTSKDLFVSNLISYHFILQRKGPASAFFGTPGITIPPK